MHASFSGRTLQWRHTCAVVGVTRASWQRALRWPACVVASAPRLLRGCVVYALRMQSGTGNRRRGMGT
eukprot:4525962-Lingulodinium_polyedra.AAC.1